MKQIKQNVNEDEVSIILIGNKCDLPTREVSTEDGEKLARKYGLTYFETSANTGHNIQEAFTHLATDIITKIQKNPGIYNKSGSSKDSGATNKLTANKV